MQNIILHLDMDSFFASVEQQANPKLVGRPVGVTKGEGRTCVIAASKEAKKFGVKTGCSIYNAKKLCPRIVFVPAEMDKYFAVSQKFIEICSRFSPDLEVFSIDELFLEVTQTAKFFGGSASDRPSRDGVSGICRGIKESLKKEVGEYITCSIGISYNRLLAKLASGMKKPDGIFAITPENRDEVLFSSKLTDVCGLGSRLERRLFNLGITNFKALREVPQECLEASLGPFWPKELKKLSYGEDDSLLTRIGEIPKAKSISRTFTLYENTRDLKIIKATLRNLCEEAAFKAREMGMAGREVGIAARGDNLGEGKHKTLRYFIDSGKDVFEVVWQLFEEIKWPGSIRFLGVWLSLLKPKSETTLSLFPEEKRKENLVAAMDKVNKRFGELTVYPAVLLQGSLIKSEVNGFLGDKAFRFGEYNKL
jgi:DNA polymerase-4